MKRLTHQKPLRDAVIAVRMPQKLKERVLEVESKTRIPPCTLIQELLESACGYVEKNGEIRMPFQLVPCRELETLRSLANHDKNGK